jgi:hypothetical protein
MSMPVPVNLIAGAENSGKFTRSFRQIKPFAQESVNIKRKGLSLKQEG